MVTTTTPFIALAPYIAVAAASLKISKLSMSSGFNPATDEPINVAASPLDNCSLEIFTKSSSIIPSTTQRGLLSPFKDDAPRIRIFGAAPKVPETFWTDTPATWPSNILLTSWIPFLSASIAFILVDDPVNSFLFSS
ncbi:hypothetical protein D3C80_1393660 [compost metagenome]